METERGRRELTVFFREKKDILLGLMDGMIGGDGKRGGVEREEEGDEQKASQNVEAKLHTLVFPRLLVPANYYRRLSLRLMIPLTMHIHPLD